MQSKKKKFKSKRPILPLLEIDGVHLHIKGSVYSHSIETHLN